VAADHQHTKAITRQFERALTDPRVTFYGNIDVGNDITLSELRRAYPVVVLATGLFDDATLPIAGAQLDGVHGAGELVRLCNAHPEQAHEWPELGEHVALVGAGNVAIDIARILLKDRGDFTQSDINDAALTQYHRRPAKKLTLISRAPASQSKADPAMLRELAAIDGVKITHRGDFDAPAASDRIGALRVAALSELCAASAASDPRIELELRFGWTPVAFSGENRVSFVEVQHRDGETEQLKVDSVITAVGAAC
jgi:ferredoxin--NADP+ reductase